MEWLPEEPFIHFFVSNEKLAKLLEQYEEAKAVGLKLIGREELMKSIQRKANELIVAYESSLRTLDMTLDASQSRFHRNVSSSPRATYRTSIHGGRRGR